MPVLEIKFIGHKTIEPIISNLALKYNISFNVLQANIELIQNQTIGVLILEALASEDKIAAGLAYLQEQDIHVEIIGYAHND